MGWNISQVLTVQSIEVLSHILTIMSLELSFALFKMAMLELCIEALSVAHKRADTRLVGIRVGRKCLASWSLALGTVLDVISWSTRKADDVF